MSIPDLVQVPAVWWQPLSEFADRAIERAEGGAQLEIKGKTLRRALREAIVDELYVLYRSGFTVR